jgi:hypothetical protein
MRFATVAALVLAGTLSVLTANGQEVDLRGKFIKQCEYYLGSWATEREDDGSVYRGTWTVKWSPEKACLVTNWVGDTPTGSMSATRIQGWDAASQKLLVVEFGKDGSSSIERYTIVSDRIDEGDITRVDANGKRHKATARTDRMKKDVFTWTVTEDGKTMAIRFRRVKK